MTVHQLDLSPGRLALQEQLASLRSGPLQFAPVVSIVEWVEQHGRISKDVSAEPGEVRLYGYQKGFLLALADNSNKRVAVLKAARVGYTQVSALAIAYFLAHEGTSVLAAQPDLDEAKDFYKTNIEPMFRDMEPLKKILRPITRQESQDTILDHTYRNGATLKLRGAASDDSFRRITTRINLGDEVDADNWQPSSEKSQGDKFTLMEKRGSTFWNSRLIVGSSPNMRDRSLIWREWLKSDQRRYYVPCPHCQEMQYLKWGGKDVEFGFKWKLDAEGRIENVWYVCEHCGGVIEERDKSRMDELGEWRPTAVPKRPGSVGFHMWTGMSMFPGAAWKNIVQEWLDAVESNDFQPFINTVLGEPFDALEGKVVQPEGLAQRREPYPAEVPDGVVAITAGIDVQSGSIDQNVGSKARLEVSIWGWGRGEESWLIAHHILDENEPFSPESQKELDDLLSRPLRKRDATHFRIQAIAIDTGGGYNTEVRDYCRMRVKWNCWAIKGKNGKVGTRSASIWPRKASRKNADSWYMIDTQLAKDVWSRRLKVEAPGPAYVHFPASVGEDYFASLTAEKLTIDKRGNRHWVRKTKNETGEAWDCAVYALAALNGLKMTSKAFKDLSLAADRESISKELSVYEGPDRSAQSASAALPVQSEIVTRHAEPSKSKEESVSRHETKSVAPEAAVVPQVKPVVQPKKRQLGIARSSFMSRR